MAKCESCGHDHAGVKLAFICIGCPCPKRTFDLRCVVCHDMRNVCDESIVQHEAALKEGRGYVAGCITESHKGFRPCVSCAPVSPTKPVTRPEGV